MKSKTFAWPVFLFLMLMMVFNSTVMSQENRQQTPIKGFPEATLAILPVTYNVTGPVDKHHRFYNRLVDKLDRERLEVTKILSLLLAEKGYIKGKIAEEDFRFPRQKAARIDRAAAFSKFVRELDLKTEYALCTEFTLHLENSFEEVYTVIVDSKGGIVWEDSQVVGDPEFDENFPGTPEKCCELVSRRLVPVMALDKIPKEELAEETKQALRILRAGLPPAQSELKAIRMRLDTMKHAFASGSLTIYPVRVGGKTTDKDCARHLSDLLNAAKLCDAAVARTDPLLEGAGWPNEMEVLWRFAHAAKEYLRQHPTESDYVLFADYWFAPDGRVWAVHFVVCDRAGNWAIVDFQNNHHEDFQQIAPKTLADCDRIILQRLKKLLS